MAQPSTLYRFRIQLADVDRGVYETLELRLAMHPSESTPFLLARVIAYCLNLQEGIELTQGIGSPDEPALRVRDLTGTTLVWVDIGNPTARRLHKASKAAKSVRVYTYRDPEILIREVAGEEIHRAETIELFSLEPNFLNKLAETLDRDNDWEILHDEGELSVTVRGVTVHGEISSRRLKPSG